MDIDELLIMACVVGAVAMVGWFLARFMMGGIGDQKLRGRLARQDQEKGKNASADAKRPQIPLHRRIWEFVASPFMPKSREEQSRMRKLMGQAGIYAPSALRILIGCKVVGLAVG